jgi:hypothetical protein
LERTKARQFTATSQISDRRRRAVILPSMVCKLCVERRPHVISRGRILERKKGAAILASQVVFRTAITAKVVGVGKKEIQPSHCCSRISKKGRRASIRLSRVNFEKEEELLP